jgi:hypothetical protein
MSKNFHEAYSGPAVAPPTERATGLVFAAMALIVALIWRSNSTVLGWGLGLAAGLTLASLVAPSLLKPLNIAWFKFGMLLHKVVNPVVMMALFLVAIVPAGLIMQLVRDPLQRRRKPGGESYWIKPDPASEAPRSMKNPY